MSVGTGLEGLTSKFGVLKFKLYRDVQMNSATGCTASSNEKNTSYRIFLYCSGTYCDKITCVLSYQLFLSLLSLKLLEEGLSLKALLT